jgi:replicative DNA helicase
MLDNEGTLTGDLSGERLEYERLFCACAFVNPQGALEKCPQIEPCDFSDSLYGEFWKGIKEHGDPMRAATEAHILSSIAGYSTQITSSLYPEYYASEMKRYEYLGNAANEISTIAVAISQRDENMVRDKVAKLHTMDPSYLTHKVRLPSEISEEFIRCINAQSPSLLTGIKDLDDILGGLFMGEMTIMAGRPGIGKTSVATAIAQNIATANKDAKILFFSLEMDKLQLWARMACAKTSYSWKEIRSGRANSVVIREVETASKQLEIELEDRLIIEDSVWDIPTMIGICANLRPSLVIVDHLSEIRWKDDNADEVKWFGRATKILRTEISRRMHIPVILIHQLNRGVEGREKKRPLLSDLKWSGDLEAIADAVIMLYREDYYDDNNSNKPQVVPMEMWIRKNRQGVMNSCAVVNFDTKTQMFSQARAPSYNNNSSGLTTTLNQNVLRIPMVDNAPHKWYNKEDE